MSEFFPTAIDYTTVNDRTVVRLFGRDSKGKRKIVNVSGIEPYFYVDAKETEIMNYNDARIIRIEKAPPSLKGKPTRKIICNVPSEVSGKDDNYLYIKDNFKDLYESDVLFGSRVKIDYELNYPISIPDDKRFISIKDIKKSEIEHINPNIKYIDIETAFGPDNSIAQTIAGNSEILAIGIFETSSKKYTILTTAGVYNKFEVIDKVKDFWASATDNLKTELKEAIGEDDIKRLKKLIIFQETNLEHILDSIDIEINRYEYESELLEAFLSFMEEDKSDILCGWNFENFDMPTIVNRLKKLNMPYQRLSDVGEVYSNEERCVIKGMVVMDLMDRYINMQQNPPPRRGLDYIGKRELGIGKLIAGGAGLYDEDPDTFVAYNVLDVMLCVELDRVLHIIDFYIQLAERTSSSLSDISKSWYIDNLILSYLKGKYVLPTRALLRKEHENDDKKMSGGIVYSPSPGLHKNVLVLDFAGMYPSIMLSLNISPETKTPDGDITAANGVKFSSSKIGVIPSILIALKKERAIFKAKLKKYKKEDNPTKEKEFDLKQNVIKILMNSFYGVMGFKGFRLSDRDVGDAVTSTGRHVSQGVKKFVEDLGYKVIGGDTDSLFILLKEASEYEKMKKEGNLLVEKINNFLPDFMKQEFNIDNCQMSIDLDKIFHSLLMLPKKSKKGELVQAKKRYAGYILNEEGIVFAAKGIEYVKGNIPQLTKYAQENMLKYALENNNDKIIEFARSLYNDFFNGDIDISHIARPCRLGKNLDEYAVDTEIKRGCIYANTYLQKNYVPGSSFAMFLVEGEIDILCIDFGEEMPTNFKLDIHKTWNKIVESPTETILQSRGLLWDDIIHGISDSKVSQDDLFV